MKKIFLYTILSFIIFGCSVDNSDIQILPVTILQGNVILRTQADVDAIGAQRYNVINGYLNIGDRWAEDHIPVPSDITDLSPLNTIISVTRQVEIQSNPLLTSLEGLSQLSVASGLIVNDNENLASLDGLTNFRAIEGNSFVSRQTVYSGGVISFLNNASLTSIEALSNINPQVLNSVSVNTTGLTSLEGLENITNVATLQVINNNNLTSLAALEGLTAINNTLLIFGNDLLSNYCILQAPLQNNSALEIYNVSENQFNPTQQNIIDGDCSQ
ncbi:hypothetical protein [Kordia sp.]|uniref:hypothetical protein n=1 Tax=Kordia sp. TaxID=1965332 RepID=UPI003D6A4494